MRIAGSQNKCIFAEIREEIGRIYFISRVLNRIKLLRVSGMHLLKGVFAKNVFFSKCRFYRHNR